MSHQGRYFMTILPCRVPLHITQLLSQRQLIFYQKTQRHIVPAAPKQVSHADERRLFPDVAASHSPHHSARK